LAVAAQLALLLQFCEGGGIRRMTVNVDDSRPDRGGAQSQPEKAFGCDQIPLRRQQEIDGVWSKNPICMKFKEEAGRLPNLGREVTYCYIARNVRIGLRNELSENIPCFQ
jgi:hypothetical protein